MADNKVIKEQDLYQNLQERYEEACNYLQDLIKISGDCNQGT